jgi:tape measure domain-containing protein
MADRIGSVALMLTANSSGVIKGLNDARMAVYDYEQSAQRANVRILGFTTNARRFNGPERVRRADWFVKPEKPPKEPRERRVRVLKPDGVPGMGVLKTALSFFTGYVFVRALSEMVGAAKEVAHWAWETATAYQDAAVAFEVMTGTRTAGVALLDQIQQLAVDTPFKSTELIAEAKLLKAYGVETYELIETLRRLGDVASGTGVDLGRLSLAYGQVVAKGRFQATELRQFTEAGVGVAAFAKVAKMSTGQFLNAMEQGKIGADVVVQAFKNMTSAGGMFFGMMDKRSKTVKGRFDALVESLEIFVQKIGLKVFEATGLDKFFDRIVRSLKGMDMNAIGNWVERAAQGLKPLAQTAEILLSVGWEYSKVMFGVSGTWEDIRKDLAGIASAWLPIVLDTTNDIVVAFNVLVNSVKTCAKGLQVVLLLWKALPNSNAISVTPFGQFLGGMMGGDTKAINQRFIEIKTLMSDLIHKMNFEAANGTNAFDPAGFIIKRITDHREKWIEAGKFIGYQIGKGVDAASKSISPTFRAIIDDATKEIGNFVREASPATMFKDEVTGLLVGRLRDMIGFDGLDANQLDKSLFLKYRELEKKFGGDSLPSLSPLIESGSQQAVKALSDARAEYSQSQGPTLERIEEVLRRAEDHERLIQKNTKDTADAVKKIVIPRLIGFGFGGAGGGSAGGVGGGGYGYPGYP